MIKIVAFSSFILLSLILEANSSEETFEFENTVTKKKEDELWVWRSEASGLKSLHVDNSMGKVISVKLELCLKTENKTKKDVTVSIKNLRYSNDGESDQLHFEIDKEHFADFMTTGDSERGHGWNKYRNSGTIGSPVHLKPGRRELVITIKTDDYGAELDYILMKFENQDPAEEVFCKSSIKFKQ